MKTKIPTPVLAQLQEMFHSGMTLQDVTEAFEDETSGGRSDARIRPLPLHRDQPLPKIFTDDPINTNETIKSARVTGCDQKMLPSQSLDVFQKLVAAVQKLGEGIYILRGHEKVRNSVSLSKASKSLVSSTQSLAKQINTINGLLPYRDTASSGADINRHDRRVANAPIQASPKPATTPDQNILAKSPPNVLSPARSPTPIQSGTTPVKKNTKVKAASGLIVPKPKFKRIKPTSKAVSPSSDRPSPPPMTPNAVGPDVQSKITAAIDQIASITRIYDDDNIDLEKDSKPIK